jgi:hypothetical protein
MEMGWMTGTSEMGMPWGMARRMSPLALGREGDSYKICRGERRPAERLRGPGWSAGSARAAPLQ